MLSLRVVQQNGSEDLLGQAVLEPDLELIDLALHQHIAVVLASRLSADRDRHTCQLIIFTTTVGLREREATLIYEDFNCEPRHDLRFSCNEGVIAVGRSNREVRLDSLAFTMNLTSSSLFFHACFRFWRVTPHLTLIQIVRIEHMTLTDIR